MKILLTGAAGFTGRFFADVAEKAGHVTVPLLANLTDKQSLINEVASVCPDAVVHLAAISYVGHANYSEFYDVNTVGTSNLLDAIASLPQVPAKVLVASSANVYGNCDVSPISESQPPAPVNHYAISKLAMEFIAKTYMSKLPIIITRPFNYTGPGQSANFVIPKLVSHYARRAPLVELGNLHIEREFNDVRMICDAYLALLEYGKECEVYNICSGHSYTLEQVMNILSELTSHNLQANINPDFVRTNEVHSLFGNPAKLKQLLFTSGVIPNQYSLRQTLISMLENV